MKTKIIAMKFPNNLHITPVRKLFFAFFVLLSSWLNAQTDTLTTEVITVVKPYTPSLSDAFKIKETPVLTDSVTREKKEVNYTIFSVPVASTFTPSKGKAAKIENQKPPKLYDNYASLGAGNYTTILGELFTNFEVTKNDNLGLFFKHNSTRGGIKNVAVKNTFSVTKLDATYSARERFSDYTIGAGVKHRLLHWYGFPFLVTQPFLDELDANPPRQSHLVATLGGDVYFKENVLKTISVHLYNQSDAFKSSELQGIIAAEAEIPVSDFNLNLIGTFDYLKGSFKNDYFDEGAISYGFLNIGVQPSLQLTNNDLSVTLGVSGFMSVSTQVQKTQFYLYPNIKASYRLIDELLTVYGGITGDLNQNSYRGFTDENPFVSPTLTVLPTSTAYNAFGGIKGMLTRQISYNLKAGYSNENNKPFFLSNRPLLAENLKEYQYGNSFQTVYDTAKTVNLFGEVKVEPSTNMSIGAQVELFSYTLDNLSKAYNLPTFKTTLFADFTITEKIFGGMSLFYVGNRYDVYYIDDVYVPFDIEVGDFLDLNLQLNYKHSDRLSFFLKGNNLLGKNYLRWIHFPVQGTQAMAGATYKFDW